MVGALTGQYTGHLVKLMILRDEWLVELIAEGRCRSCVLGRRLNVAVVYPIRQRILNYLSVAWFQSSWINAHVMISGESV